MKGYDNWKLATPPYYEVSRDEEEAWDTYGERIFYNPEDGSTYKLSAVEVWTDADEDGKHLVVDLIMEALDSPGHTETFTSWAVDDFQDVTAERDREMREQMEREERR